MFIARELQSIKEADRILVLQDGYIVQRGVNDKLVKQEGIYRRMWHKQNRLSAGSLDMTNKIPMLDPRSKILILVMISIYTFSGQLLTEGIGVIFICSIMLLYGRTDSFIKSAATYAVIALLVLVCSGITNIWASMLSVMLIMIRKMLSIILFASFLISTTKVGEVIAALQHMKIPKSIVIPAVVMVRFFPTLGEEYHHILDAMKIRGIRVNIKNIILHPLKLSEYILVPMILRLSTISDELSAAAVSRGIDAKIQRTSYYDIKFHYVDLLFLGLFAALTIFTLSGGSEVLQ